MHSETQNPSSCLYNFIFDQFVLKMFLDADSCFCRNSGFCIPTEGAREFIYLLLALVNNYDIISCVVIKNLS